MAYHIYLHADKDGSRIQWGPEQVNYGYRVRVVGNSSVGTFVNIYIAHPQDKAGWTRVSENVFVAPVKANSEVEKNGAGL